MVSSGPKNGKAVVTENWNALFTIRLIIFPIFKAPRSSFALLPRPTRMRYLWCLYGDSSCCCLKHVFKLTSKTRHIGRRSCI